jgi:SAM-dependent methyltransferase
MLAPMADAVLACLDPRPGERIVDVGAGTATLALAIADRVRPAGHVTALDVSPTMLGRAAERIIDEGGGDTISVLLADAQTQPLPLESFDAVASRFGVMFFDDPVAAFTNLGSATRSGGRLAMAVWQPLERNEMFSLPDEVVARHVGPEAEEPAWGPGPFGLADEHLVGQVLVDAGWTEVGVADTIGTLLLGGPATVEVAVDFTMRRTAVTTALTEADESTRAAVRADMVDTLAGRHDGEGVRLGYAVWIVSARRP